jgi:Tfp pilus assembly protein PilF
MKTRNRKTRNSFKYAGTVLLAVTFGASAQALADGGVGQVEMVEPGYEMSVVLDRAEGKALQQGHYQRAILRIPKHRGSDPFANLTNLCVAHTMVGQFRHAEHYCDEALTIAARDADKGRRPDRDYTARWAIAYSNRGVLKVMLHDEEGARQDFARAIELESSSEAPVHNLAFMNAESLDVAAAD